ncbi:MAG: hypothetical protein PUJ55_03540 [Clostridiales bacterium]|nr:hypothetical protein [Clostridiales bacterium]
MANLKWESLKNNKNMIEKNATFGAILEKCIQILATERDFAVSINQFLKYVGEYYNANRVYILEFDWKSNVADNTYEWCAEGVEKEIDNLKGVPLEYISSWVDRLKCDGEICSSDSVGDCLMAVPLYSGSTMIGLIEADGLRKHAKELCLMRVCSYLVTEQLGKKEMNCSQYLFCRN